jgi:type IV secretion system protein VirD4
MKLSLPSASQKLGLGSSGVIQRAVWIALIMLVVGASLRFPFMALIAGLVLLARLGAARVTSEAYGSARFAEYDDLEKGGLLGPKGLILGRSVGKRASLFRAIFRLFVAPISESAEVCKYLRFALLGKRGPATPLIRLQKGVHGLVCAPPGAGKGVGFVIPNLLTYPGSTVAIDPKGELHAATARVRRKRLGNRVVRLDPLGVRGPGGARLNPLMHIDPTSPLVGDHASALAEALVVRTGREAEDHWNDSSQLGITGAILYVVTYAAPADRNLNSVADLLTSADGLSGMIQMMKDDSGDLAPVSGHTHAYKLLRRYGNTMATWQDRELNSIQSSIGRHLVWLHSPLIAENLATSDFNPRNLLRQDITVYLILPPKYLTTLSRLLRLWVTTLYGAITEGGPQEKREVLFMLDEAGTSLGPLPALYQALVLGRGYGVRIWLILQGLSQLKTLFPKDGEHQSAEAAIDNRVMFGVRDYATAEAVSNYLGTATVAVTSETTNRGTTENGNVVGMLLGEDKYTRSVNKGNSQTVSETGRKLLMPDEILQLPADVAVILSKATPPILARLAKYYEAPELAELMPDVGSVK